MSDLSTLPKGDSAWLFRKAIERIMQQVSVLETNIGSSTTGNSANTQIIFNDDGTLRGDAGLVYNKTTDALTVAGLVTAGSATITGDLTVDTSTLKVDSTNNRVGIGTATPALPLDVAGGIQVTSGSAGGLYQWAYGASASSRSWRAWNDVSANGDFQISTSTTRTGSTYSDRYRIDVTGIHEWFNTSGTAMTLNSTGLGIGASPTSKLTIGLGAYAAGTLSGTSSLYSTVGQGLVVLADGFSVFTRAGADRFILDTNGNVGVGITPSAWYTSYGTKAFQFAASGVLYGLDVSSGDRRVGLLNNGFINTSGVDTYINTGHATKYQQATGAHSWLTAPSGTAGNAITFTQAMTLDASGNLILLSSNTPATLTTNGQLTVNATSNTNLRFSYRGSDGTTRVANLTLA